MSKVTNDKIEVIDLDREIVLRIGDGKTHSPISWQLLRELGTNLEKLIQALAYNASEDKDIFDPENFRIDFIGSENGGSILRFALTKQLNFPLFSDYHIRQQVNIAFSYVMSRLSRGNVVETPQPFRDTTVKNEILLRAANFSNIAKQIPLSMMQREREGKLKTIYKIRPISKDVLAIFSEAQENEETPSSTEIIPALAKVMIKRNKAGKESRRTTGIYTDKEAQLTMKFSEIPFKNKLYVLNFPLSFGVIDQEKRVILENKELSIVANGRTINDAKAEVFYQFNQRYTTLMKMKDNQLSESALRTKKLLKIVIATINDNS